MKVLASAYSCAPAWGSEPGAGWQWARASAVKNEVWLLTQDGNREFIEPWLDRFEGLRERIHPVYVPVPRWARRLKAGEEQKHLLHYIAWQRAAGAAGRRLHREMGFDVAHHLTWTVAWLPCGVSRIPGLPLVWGPVSGGAGIPKGYWRWLGWRGRIQEGLREIALPLARGVFGKGPLRRSSLVLASSEEFARWARRKGTAPVVVEPVVAFQKSQMPEPGAHPVTGNRNGRTAIFAARMVPWKGLRLVIAAIARPQAAGWTLDVYGTGPEEAAGRELARKLGVEERVRFLGHQERPKLDAALQTADAFVHPSVHDAPPFVVAEALGTGCPVICIDHGGPTVLIGEGEGVKVAPGKDLAGGIAAALASAPPRFEPSRRWLTGRLPDRLEAWYRTATDREGRKPSGERS